MEVGFLDVQGFVAPPKNKFILKEIALYFEKEGKWFHFFIKSPFKWEELPSSYKKINNWLMRNQHGLLWECGDEVSFKKVEEILKRNISVDAKIIVKGREKSDWCKKLFPTFAPQIINISDDPEEDEDCNIFRLKDLPKIKDYHCNKHQGICALNNVKTLSKIIDYESCDF